ncbi:MAG: hypothetical protein J7L75_03260 [Thermoproteales archaeon]|nr:hypothetical protein [Thermoproteales archaeon]
MDMEARRTLRLVVDTSLLMCCIEDRKSLKELVMESFEAPVEVIVPDAVLRELSSIARNRGRRGALARIALEEIKRLREEGYCKVMEAGEGNVDDLLIKLAKELNAYIASADEGLRRKARSLGVGEVAYLKAQKRLSPLP